MRVSVLVICGGIAASVALSGCSQFRTAVGLDKQVPNEFDVVANAPLAIPPDFNLRPPQPGAPPTQGETPTLQAKETIFRAAGDNPGTASPNDAQLSAGESDILRAAGAENAPGNIRQVVNQEAATAHPLTKSFVNRLMFWRKNPEARRELLDPMKETARLEAEASAKTIATQFTTPPTIERKSDSGSFFDRLF